jgi:hypothetical protein
MTVGANSYPDNPADKDRRPLGRALRAQTTGNSSLSWYAWGLAVGASNAAGSQDPSP